MLLPHTPYSVSLSDMDFRRFGCVTAKAFVRTEEDVRAAMEFCINHNVQLLIIRCPASAYAAIGKLSVTGAQLMDTLVCYARDLSKSPAAFAPAQHTVRFIEAGEETHIRSVAQEAFKDYPGHYYLDTRLDRDACNEVYVDWARRSCIDKAMADHVLVASLTGKIAGFLALRIVGDAMEIVLNAVRTQLHGQGVYRSLVKAAILLAQEKNMHALFVSTQITNVAVQKTWIRCGMEPHHSAYTFHHWF